MKKSWMWFLFGALLAAGGVPMSARAQSNVVYAVEYNQSTNLFGTIDLLSGNFTKIASFGSMLINDIAYCPTNGTLYGISNTTALVTFNTTNGAITRIGSLSVSGIESLAFRYSDGALFGATSSKLYTVNPANGTATLVGNYGSPTNLGTTGQNIRFAQDGNLYVSNTSTNTDVYRINTTNGAATRMGQAVGFPYLMLQNASSNMYGVFINLGSGASNATPELVTLNLSSFVNGGTNANGSTHQITVTMVGAGTNFPPNFNFSGNVPQVVTNLTVPVSASGPSNQTAVVGSNVVFSTVASGTGPYNYAWLENGVVISGQTNSSLTLSNVTTSSAATYSVIVGGELGTVTNSATLTVNVPVTVNVPPTNQTAVVGNNVIFSVTATGTGLSYQWLFNGSVIGSSNSLTLNNVTTSQAGIYTVIVNGAVGSATNSATLTVNKAAATVTLGSLSQTYTGAAEAATATTTPSGLAVTFTYNGSANAPTNAGSYTVIGTINDANYQGSATNTLVIAQAGAIVALGNLNQTYSGSAEAATATTTPTGLTVNFTYNGSANAPTNAGSYTVIGTINNPNYTGSATNTLVIAQASGAVTLGSLNQTYNGTAKMATAATAPSGLAVTLTYNGSANAPTNAGSYMVIGTINNPNYTGSATNTLVISQASGAVALGNLSQTYSGTAKAATAGTTPSGLTVTLTYNGSANAPTNAGSYMVIGTINDANYQGSATNTLVISQASGTVTLGNLSQTYTGTAEAATAATIPS
ncbi:MAG: MBG domain-containing protein, partial [Verrucomicrobiia bacterium]